MATQPKTAITDVKQTTSMHPVHRPSSFTLRLVWALLAGLCHAGPLSAETYTWNGSSSGFWATTTNWSGILNIPLTNDEAVFPVQTQHVINEPRGQFTQAGPIIHMKDSLL